jgi:hypothetical protein
MLRKLLFPILGALLCLVLAAPGSNAAEKRSAKGVTIKTAEEPVAPKPAVVEETEPVQTGQSAKTASTINWQVIAGGGGRGTSTNYIVNGTAGQTAAGPGTSTSYNLNSGYWQVFPSGGSSCCTLAGDANADGSYNISDAVHIINNVFKGGPTPVCCDAADANGDGSYNISDAVHIINNVFKGGPGPVCGSAGNGPC